MIVGVGVDLCDVARFERVARRWGDRFLHRVFTDGERGYSTGVHDMERLAARFAAKEAARKALGAHVAGGWRDVEVVSNRETGAPSLAFHGGAASRAEALSVKNSLVSLTHQSGLAVAVVVLET